MRIEEGANGRISEAPLFFRLLCPHIPLRYMWGFQQLTRLRRSPYAAMRHKDAYGVVCIGGDTHDASRRDAGAMTLREAI